MIQKKFVIHTYTYKYMCIYMYMYEYIPSWSIWANRLNRGPSKYQNPTIPSRLFWTSVYFCKSVRLKGICLHVWVVDQTHRRPNVDICYVGVCVLDGFRRHPEEFCKYAITVSGCFGCNVNALNILSLLKCVPRTWWFDKSSRLRIPIVRSFTSRHFLSFTESKRTAHAVSHSMLDCLILNAAFLMGSTVGHIVSYHWRVLLENVSKFCVAASGGIWGALGSPHGGVKSNIFQCFCSLPQGTSECFWSRHYILFFGTSTCIISSTCFLILVGTCNDRCCYQTKQWHVYVVLLARNKSQVFWAVRISGIITSSWGHRAGRVCQKSWCIFHIVLMQSYILSKRVKILQSSTLCTLPVMFHTRRVVFRAFTLRGFCYPFGCCREHNVLPPVHAKTILFFAVLRYCFGLCVYYLSMISG